MGNAVRGLLGFALILAAGSFACADTADAAVPGDFQEARVLPDSRVPLSIPPGAIRPGEEPVFTFMAHVLADGSVASVDVPEGTAKGVARAATTAIRQWRYEPATTNGLPVESDVVVTVRLRASMPTMAGMSMRDSLALGKNPLVVPPGHVPPATNSPAATNGHRGPTVAQRPGCTQGSGKNCLIDKQNMTPIESRLVDLPRQTSSGSMGR